ncbi:unnamed protein product [Didymodactylos carnosus]|uniref:HAT C-terminal dimerisation domain-containing protein n=1 Tax=Didymodactylos carnosus TaxID=1234261 RepID=A0A815JTP1_9BILA|nr:unnamed protein product [Didymodactylos carnosus]CAF4279252.1 unnamed protein product [Didymodactylos carnosus]
MEATQSPNSSKRSASNSIESNETQLQPKDKKLENEIERYLALNVETNDVLQWWNASKLSYPCLSKLAKTILSIPSTFAPSEEISRGKKRFWNGRMGWNGPEWTTLALSENFYFL